MAFKKWSVQNLEQLALQLELEEEPLASPLPRGEGKAVPSPEEARLKSETARAALELRGQQNAPVWMETYQRLLDTGWPWRIACYIAWAASPKVGRYPKNQEELASEVLGLSSDRQIATWRKKNPGIDQVIAMMQAAPLLDHRADIYAALAASASSSSHHNHQDRKLALTLLGDYTEKIRIDDRRGEVPDDLSELSEAELALLAGKPRTSSPPPAVEPEGSEDAHGPDTD